MWRRTARLDAHPLVFAPLCFGQSLALAGGCRWSWTMFAWAIAVGVLVHALIAFGRAAADGPRRDRPPHRATIALTFGSLLALAAAGAVLAFHFDRAFMLALAMLPSMLLWLDSFPPLALRRRGREHWLHAAAIGVVLPLLGLYLQCGEVLPLLPIAIGGSLVAGIAHGLAISRFGDLRTRLLASVALMIAVALTPAMFPDAPGGLAWSVAAVSGGLALYAITRRRDAGRFVFAHALALVVTELGWVASAGFSRLPLV